jgi:hypothetical protein
VQKVSFRATEELLRNQPFLIRWEWPDIERITVDGGFGFKSNLRVAGSLFGFMAGLSAAVYVYNVPERGVAAITLLTADSEHEFWRPIFANMVRVSPI